MTLTALLRARIGPGIAIALLLMAPTAVLASDFRGFLSGVIIFAAGSMSAAASLLVFAILAIGRSYRKARVAKLHAMLASAVPLLGFAAMMVEGSSVPRGAIDDRLVFNGIALALAMLPLIAHSMTSDERSEDQVPPP